MFIGFDRFKKANKTANQVILGIGIRK